MRYTFEKTEGRKGFFTATDTTKGVSVTFREHEFQETQEWAFSPEAQNNSTVYLNRIADALEAWLRIQHPETLSQAEKYILKRSEDGKTITLTMPGCGMEVKFPAEMGKVTAASFLRNASFFLKKSADHWDNVDF